MAPRSVETMSDRSLQSGYYSTITYLAELLDEALV